MNASVNLFLILILLFILLAFVCFCFYIITLWYRLQKYNQHPLNIRTFDGSNSPYHPAVLYFENGWNGYKYWMAETPFSPGCKPYRDRNECPSIHVSNDGTSWIEIIQNPIDDLTEQEIKELDYFSDPHLVFVEDRIECWYRISRRHGKISNHGNIELVKKVSYDGIHWKEREVMVDFINGTSLLGCIVVSPAILFQNNEYRMWYVNREQIRPNDEVRQRELHHSTSRDGKLWKKSSKCVLIGKNVEPWHIDVNFIDGRFWLTCYDYNDITLWSSDDGINFTFLKTLVQSSVNGSFYGRGLYRAVLIKDNTYKLYFSANNISKTSIGLMEGITPEELTIKSPTNKKYCTLGGMLYQIWLHKRRSLLFISKRFINITIGRK